jgi:hypothetical protein
MASAEEFMVMTSFANDQVTRVNAGVSLVVWSPHDVVALVSSSIVAFAVGEQPAVQLRVNAEDLGFVDGDILGVAWNPAVEASKHPATVKLLVFSHRKVSCCDVKRENASCITLEGDTAFPILHVDALATPHRATTETGKAAREENSAAIFVACTWVRGQIDKKHGVWVPLAVTATSMDGAVWTWAERKSNKDPVRRWTTKTYQVPTAVSACDGRSWLAIGDSSGTVTVLCTHSWVPLFSTATGALPTAIAVRWLHDGKGIIVSACCMSSWHGTFDVAASAKRPEAAHRATVAHEASFAPCLVVGYPNNGSLIYMVVGHTAVVSVEIPDLQRISESPAVSTTLMRQAPFSAERGSTAMIRSILAAASDPVGRRVVVACDVAFQHAGTVYVCLDSANVALHTTTRRAIAGLALDEETKGVSAASASLPAAGMCPAPLRLLVTDPESLRAAVVRVKQQARDLPVTLMRGEQATWGPLFDCLRACKAGGKHWDALAQAVRIELVLPMAAGALVAKHTSQPHFERAAAWLEMYATRANDSFGVPALNAMLVKHVDQQRQRRGIAKTTDQGMTLACSICKSASVALTLQLESHCANGHAVLVAPDTFEVVRIIAVDDGDDGSGVAVRCALCRHAFQLQEERPACALCTGSLRS